MKPFRLAILNLFRRKISTSIVIISIAISVACSGLLLRAYQMSSSRFATLAKGGDAIVGAKNSGLEILLGCLNSEGKYPDFIPYVLFESLRKEQKEPGYYASTKLLSVIPIVYFAKYKNYRVIGTDESIMDRPDKTNNIKLAKGNWAKNIGEVVLGSKIADKERLNINDVIKANPWVSNYTDDVSKYPTFQLKVTGIFSETNSNWDYNLFSNTEQAHDVFTTFADTNKLSIWGAKVLHYYIVYLEQEGRVPFVDLINKRTVAQVVFINDEIKRLEELMSVGKNLGLLITAMIILLGGLAVAAMMITRFDSMKIQLAVLRAIGYKKNEIALWLLWEGIILGVIACLFGALLDVALFPALKSFLGIGLPDTPFISSGFYQSYPIWLITIAATSIAAYIPMIIYYRLDIHSSLKGL
jgi:ABC-type lipoprotein release transport system permease subunit